MKILVWTGAAALACASVFGDGAGPVFDHPEPKQFVDCATAREITYRTIPARWLVDDWHRLGVKVKVLMAPESYESPELFRRRFGLHVFRSGVDGVEFEGSAEDRAFYGSAMKAAADDVALVRRLDDLAEKAMRSKEAPVRTAGRLAKVYVHISANFGEVPTALVRRELVLKIRALQKTLGEAPMAMPADIPDAPARRFTPPRNARTVKVGGAYEWVSVFSNVTFNAGGHGFTFGVSDGRKLPRNTWPGVKREFTLFIPASNRTEWLVYKLACDLTDRKPADAAKKSAPRVQFYTLEPRFAAAEGKRFVTRPMHLPCRAKPGLRLGYTYEAPILLHAGDSGPWSFTFAFDWPQIYGIVPNAKTVWYVCEGDDWVRLEWHPVDAFGGLSFRDFVGNYQKFSASTLSEWSYDDSLFARACVQPLVDANVELVAMLSKKIQPNGYISWNPSEKFIFKKAKENADRMGHFAYDVTEARIRYLDDVFAGREIKMPERKKKVEKKVTGPSLDESEEGMSLDDSEY